MKTYLTLILFVFSGVAGGTFAQNARQYYRTGITFVENGNHKDAIDQFTKALDIDPQFIQAYIDRAISYEALGDLRLASDDYKRALNFEPRQYELYYEAARINFNLAEFRDALELVNKSISINRKSESSFLLLARINMALEDYSNSLTAINRALDLKKNAENYYYHGVLSEHMMNYLQAEKDYNAAVEINEKYTDALLALAKLKLILNKPEEALVSCNSILMNDAGHKEALLLRSRVYAGFSEYPKAIDDVSRILSDNSEDRDMYLVRGNYYQEFTQHQQAINDFSKALLLDQTFSEAIYKRAYSYEQIGDFKAAIRDYEKLTELSGTDLVARQHLESARNRLFELNREAVAPQIVLLQPSEFTDSSLKIARNKSYLTLRGKIKDDSEIRSVVINRKPAAFFRNGDFFEFTAEIDISVTDLITIQARDVYDNSGSVLYSIIRTEVDAPAVAILTPYASDNGEIYLDTDNANLYIEGRVSDESNIQSILIEGVAASFILDELNPGFTANINVANKNKFNVTVTDVFGNDTTMTFALNREGVSLLEANPMGRTWVVFIENSNYETLPSLEGPARDINLMRASLTRYNIHKIIHKQDMSKKEMERFFSIELRDLLRSNNVNSLMIWYAGHGRFYNETGYWIPVDASKDDEFTYYNLNALRASLQSYTGHITHNLVITDACESGPSFSQAMRETPGERNCNDWEAVRFKSSQVFSSAGTELAVDNSQFTKTFASTLDNNTNACIPIESIVNKVTLAVTQSNRQKPLFGKIAGLQDEDGTFFFMTKNQEPD